jgi:hypothetical protein
MYKFNLTENGMGSIQIDDFKESFESDFSYWPKEMYETHWLKASEEVEAGNSVSFITSITEPDSSNFIRSWSCYSIDGELIFQERILFLNDLETPFNLKEPHNNIDSYESIDEDGDKISEWRTRA